VDNITHSLFALTLANAGLRRAGRGSTAALLIASNAPDIEVLTTLTGGRIGYLAAHRGPTHGPLGFALALAAGVVVWLAVRASGKRSESASLLALVGVSSIGVLGHILMDFATSYGTRVLSPFRSTWYGVDWMPIIDVFLWAVLAAGCITARVRPEWRARVAISALLVLGCDYAVRAAAHGVALHEAVTIQAQTTAMKTPHPDTVFSYHNPGDPAELPAALPTLTSPFRWRLVTRVPGGFQVRTLNLLDRSLEDDGIVFPDDGGALVERASSSHLAQVFLDFSRFPAADAIGHRDGRTTVHWYDLRFAEPPLGTSDGRRYTSPFAVWIRLSPAGDIIGQGLGPG
jgi:membrane-bound metal-dependent hydrolase YbcI (DUF457 family)